MATQFKFTGGAGSYLGISIATFFITIFTLGLGVPWAVVMRMRWEVEHTVVDGKLLRFTGSGADLFGRYILWWVLCVITFGIYSFWVPVKIIQWKIEHTEIS